MKIIIPQKYNQMYIAMDEKKPLYAYSAENNLIEKIYMLYENATTITLHEEEHKNSNMYSGDIVLGADVLNASNANIIVLGKTTVKIPFNAFKEASINLYLPKGSALYYCIRRDVLSGGREIYTPYLLVAEKGLTSNKTANKEYILKEIPNNTRLGSLTNGDYKMTFAITSHCLENMQDKHK